MRKPRAGPKPKMDRLSEPQMDQVRSWLFELNLGLVEIAKLIGEHFGVKLSHGLVRNFWHQEMSKRIIEIPSASAGQLEFVLRAGQDMRLIISQESRRVILKIDSLAAVLPESTALPA